MVEIDHGFTAFLQTVLFVFCRIWYTEFAEELFYHSGAGRRRTIMNDYEFGNYLYELRSKAGYTQRQVALLSGVTDKAVSKWENGRSKPTTETLRKLASLFSVSVEELLSKREDISTPEIFFIVITGGPCAGKSTAMSWIQNHFQELGYQVLFVAETATELITGGVAPWTCRSRLDYQLCQAKLQLEKEKIYLEAAKNMPAERVLIVCDRGMLDNKAYMSQTEFDFVAKSLGNNETELRDQYDAVFHLVTAAKGAEEAYTRANNAARTETPEQAAALDDKLIDAWTGHPHLRVIDNATDFEDKMRRLIAEISAFLGEPEPFEIERKFLIRYPDMNWLNRLPNAQKIEIVQTYLTAAEGEERRVRQRGADGHYTYYETIKRGLSGVRRLEKERRLSKDEYLTLLMESDSSAHPIRKTRYCLTYANQYFEIDLYPFWKDQAILEIELKDENDEISIPEEIEIIREVTDDPAYKNAALAHT